MKKRTGFVSNSSSSSFIISTEHFPKIKDLATYMIKQQMNEREEGDSDTDWYDQYMKQNKLYIERLNKLDENQAISFPSCNYDTYIKKIGDVYLVATCNNTDWDLWGYTTRLTDTAKEALEELQKTFHKKSDDYRYIGYILDGDTSEFSSFGIDYYNLYKELIGVETYDDCPKRDKTTYESDHYLWDTPRYGKICPKCNPYFQRKDKLEQINQRAEE